MVFKLVNLGENEHLEEDEAELLRAAYGLRVIVVVSVADERTTISYAGDDEEATVGARRIKDKIEMALGLQQLSGQAGNC